MKVRFRSTSLGSGAAMALPIFAYYMKSVYADNSIKINKGDFDQPQDTEGLIFDCKKQEEEAENSNSGIDANDLFDR